MTRMTLSLAAALFASSFLCANLAWSDSVLTQLSGEVEIGRGNPTEWIAAESGDIVTSNDRVRTGANGRVEIKMDSGTVRVHENSMLRLPPATREADQVELEQGRSLFDILRRGGRRFEVHTPTVVVSVKGTRFGVDAGVDVGEVTVYRGTVGVREVGNADLMETLVREGFLATGGVGIPIEIDVLETPDPWQDWQNWTGAMMDRRETPSRLREIDRAKETLHRATAADVIATAAERRPEIAGRLRQLQAKQRVKASPEMDRRERPRRSRPGRRLTSDPDDAFPASPDPGSDGLLDDGRKAVDTEIDREARTMKAFDLRRRALEAKQVIDSNRAARKLQFDNSVDIQGLAGGTNVAGSGVRFDFQALYNVSPAALILFRGAIMDVHSQYQNGTFVPTSPIDFLVLVKDNLIVQGLSPTEAAGAVQIVTGTALP